MFYLLEKRHEFGLGTMSTHYEVRSYERISTHTGALIGGKTIKRGTKEQCEKFIRTKGIRLGEL